MPYGSASLYGVFEINQSSTDLFGKLVVKQWYKDLYSKFEVGQDAVNLHGNLIIRCEASIDLYATFESQVSLNLAAKFAVGQDWKGLPCVFITRHLTSLDLPAVFWIRQLYRLWTNRRYLNGVIELTETLIGNAILEYVIEGVMQDIQSYLINAGLSYSEWTDITLTPRLIRRATTYATVAALYARRAKTFAARVIPTIAPVTITVIGDEERAMNHWRAKMSKALEYYVTSQDSDVMISSTEDEEPVFSMDDIPPVPSAYTPWYQWLMKREQ